MLIKAAFIDGSFIPLTVKTSKTVCTHLLMRKMHILDITMAIAHPETKLIFQGLGCCLSAFCHFHH